MDLFCGMEVVVGSQARGGAPYMNFKKGGLYMYYGPCRTPLLKTTRLRTCIRHSSTYSWIAKLGLKIH